MEDEIEVPVTETGPSVAAQLKQAREAAGLTVKDIAAKTRVPIRHLHNLEDENFGELPSLTYVLGFVRNYARALDLDANALVAQLREDLAYEGELHLRQTDSAMQAADPTRIPPKAFAWSALGILAAILLAYGVYKAIDTGFFSSDPAEEVEAVADVEMPAAAKPTAVTAAPNGPVVLTATGSVWLSIKTEDGARLIEKTMTKGETFTVPSDAKKPLILTGAPQLLAVTVGGKAVPPLGTGERSIKDVDISAAALLARAAPAETTPPAAPAGAE